MKTEGDRMMEFFKGSSTSQKYGKLLEEGSSCITVECNGVFEYERDEPCYCNPSNAPCSACTNAVLICPDCEYEPEEGERR